MSGPGRPATRAGLALLGWTLLLVVAAAALHALGGALAPPPLTDPGRWGRWLDGRQPAEAAFAFLRLLALVLAWYLLVVTVVSALARAVGAGSLIRAADAVTVPLVRRLVNGAVGASLAAASLSGATGAALADDQAGAGRPAAVETMRLLPGAAGGPDAPAVTPDSPVPTMQRLPDDPAAAGAGTTTTAATTAATNAAAPAPAAGQAGQAAGQHVADAGAAPRTWPVRPGDHFWSVAERVLAEAWSRAPEDHEVDPYWRTLVEANRPLLRDPANPDLIFPGQVLTLPPPPPPPPPPPNR